MHAIYVLLQISVIIFLTSLNIFKTNKWCLCFNFIIVVLNLFVLYKDMTLCVCSVILDSDICVLPCFCPAM